jgi:TolB protein
LAALAALGSLPLLGQQPPAGQPPQPPQTPEVQVVITGPSGGPPKLAIAPFVALSTDAETAAAARTITDVLYDDINYEREYYMIGKDAISTVPKFTSIDEVPLDRWKELNADGLIVGSVQKTGSGILVRMRLIQVNSGRQAIGKEYSGSIANPRQYAHTISDELHMQQLALRGVARTKLAFTSDRDAERMASPENRDIKEIYFADYDGANPRRVTVSKTLNVAPAWSPDGQALAYSSWRPAGQFGTFQDVIISYIYKGVRQTPANGNPDKQNYLPAWSPDGSKVAFTLSQGGNQEIYVMNKDGSGMRRLTNNPDIDTSPTWSPTGTQIAWVSGRSGNPQVYIMNADGTGQRKITNEAWADRPTWSRSPFNEIAYAGRTGAGFDIKIYSVASGETTKITDGIGSNESPAFSPNGRHIAFVSTRNGKAQIFTIDRDGKNLRQITREGNNGYPNWSQ